MFLEKLAALKAYASLTSLPLAAAAIITTDSIHPVASVLLGAACAALGWSGYGIYLVGHGKLKLKKFFATIGIAMISGVVSVTFLPIENFVQLLVACGLLGTMSEQVIIRARNTVSNMLGTMPEKEEKPTDKPE